MIAFLSGEVAAVLPPNTAYIDVTGVGYAVSMPQGDLGKLEVGKPARVLTYLSVSDNGLGLYGFLSDEEKALFEKLIGVSKVGPKMALAALSTYTPRELADAIAADRPYRIDCPFLLVCGEEDRAGSAKRYNRAWSRRTGIPVHWIEGAGHNANTDQPDAVNALLEEFADTVAPSCLRRQA